MQPTDTAESDGLARPRGRSRNSLFRAPALLSLTVVLLAALPSPAHAYTFTPTEAEWATWPSYCRARYSQTMWVSQTKYANRVSQGEIQSWANTLGTSFQSLHHFCAGLAYLDRLRLATDVHEREVLAGHAVDEITYSYGRVTSDSSLFPFVTTKLAIAYREIGELDKAESTLLAAIEAQPDAADPYSVLSVIYRDMGQPDKQLQILEQGNENTQQKSAELNYFLGMYYANHQNYDAALQHAKNAYELGYPLPGLRNKLKRLGYPMAQNN